MKNIILGLVLTILGGQLYAASAAVVPSAADTPSASELHDGKGTDANLVGHVIDRKTGVHLQDVAVMVKGTTIGSVTDSTGHYFIKDLPAGKVTMVTAYVGYAPAEKTIELVRGRTMELNFEIEEESLSLDGTVVSASRNVTQRKTAPAIVNVVSSKLFENTASCNLSETMSFQSGLRVENNCGNCGTVQLRMNGLEGQYSQILLDSRPIFSSLAAVYGLEQLPLSMIERVEVVRGGGSALFGANAIGGVVNIITKEPVRNTFSLSNTTNVLEKGPADFNTSFNGAFVSDDYRMGAYIFGMVRDRDSYDRNGDGFSDIPKLSSETAGFRAYYKFSRSTRLTAEYHHIHEFRRGGDNFDNPPHMAQIAEQLNHKIDGGGLTFEWFAPNERHYLSVYASAQTIDRDSYYGTGMNPDAYGKTSDVTAVAGVQYTYRFRRLFFMPAEFTAGVEDNYNALHDRYLGYGRDFTQNTNSIGAYLQNEWKNDKFSILVGVRADKHNLMEKVVVSPRVNFRWSPVRDLALRASWSSGYRAPQAYNEDLHIDALDNKVAIIRLAEGLRPEYSHSLSASADWYRSFGKVRANLLVEGFYTMLSDIFTLEKVGEDAQGNVIKERRNASGAKVGGVSLEAKAGIPGRFDVQLGYTFQKSMYDQPERWSEDVAPQRMMFRSPEHYAYMTASYDITSHFNASVFGNYTGRMLVQHNAGTIEKDEEVMTPDFWDFGLRLSYDFHLGGNLRLEINGGVKNILDAYQNDLDYGPAKDATYIYGPSLPRTYFIGAKFYL